MRFIIDRFEGNFAVCEDDQGKMRDIQINLIKGNPKEGDVIQGIDGEFQVNLEETEKRRKEIEELIKDMWS